jgi:hypothetical protein
MQSDAKNKNHATSSTETEASQSHQQTPPPEGLQNRTDQQAQSAYIRAQAALMSPPDRNAPFRVDVLPGIVTLEQALSLTPKENSEDPNWTIVGVGGDALSAIGVSFF